MLITLVAAVLVFALAGGAFLLGARTPESAARAAYAEGRRAGLKTAARIARERGDLAIQISPEGGLGVGIIRGQMAHAIELEILGEVT